MTTISSSGRDRDSVAPVCSAICVSVRTMLCRIRVRFTCPVGRTRPSASTRLSDKRSAIRRFPRAVSAAEQRPQAVLQLLTAVGLLAQGTHGQRRHHHPLLNI